MKRNSHTTTIYKCTPDLLKKFAEEALEKRINFSSCESYASKNISNHKR